MAEQEPAPAPSQHEPAPRPAPPPFRPNKDLIGYIEKGQRPPTRPTSPPSEKR
jgi:hypothetical protein